MVFLKKYNDFDSLSGLTVFSAQRLQTNALETKDGYVLDINAAGIKKENIKISYNDSYLTISIERQNDDARYIIKEISTSACKRSFYLPDIDDTTIKAQLNDGVLTITMNKKDTKKSDYIAIE